MACATPGARPRAFAGGADAQRLRRAAPGHAAERGGAPARRRILRRRPAGHLPDTDLWQDARAQFGQGGPFLFGAFTIADAFYAPVVSRFTTYGVSVTGDARAYMDAVLAHPAMQEWIRDSQAEAAA